MQIALRNPSLVTVNSYELLLIFSNILPDKSPWVYWNCRDFPRHMNLWKPDVFYS